MNRPAPITVWITRTVRSGCEAAFEQALHDFVQCSLTQPDQLGVHVLRPPVGSSSREYRVARSFSDRHALKCFRDSEAYRQWSAHVRDLTEGEPRFETLNGLESWFTPASLPLRPLPQWKMALLTFVGVYPLTSILPPLFTSLLPSWPPLLVNVVVTGLIVAALTWAVMPGLTRVFKSWLNADSTSPS